MDELGRLLYVATITIADDDGRFQADPAVLHGRLFVGLRYTIEDVTASMGELDRIGLVRVYQAAGEWVGDHPKWSEYQHPKYRKPSKLPAFRADCPRFGADSARVPANVGHGVGVGVGVGVVAGVGVGEEPSTTRSTPPALSRGSDSEPKNGKRKLDTKRAFAFTDRFRGWYERVYGRPHAGVEIRDGVQVARMIARIERDKVSVPLFETDPAEKLVGIALTIVAREAKVGKVWFLRGEDEALSLRKLLAHWPEMWDRICREAQARGLHKQPASEVSPNGF